MKSKTKKTSRPTNTVGSYQHSTASHRIQIESALICASILAMVTGANAQSASTTTAKAGTASKQSGFSWVPAKPAWLTDLGVTAKESYDDNIYGVSGKLAGEKGSWITAVAPTVGVNLAPLFGDSSPIKALALGYNPEVDFFHNAPSENFTAHRFAQTVKVKADAFTVNLENGLNYIDGNDKAPIYAGNDSQRSAYATAMPRERREQIQDRSKVVIQYDQSKWFARLTGSLLSYDLLTDLSAQSGYQNYVSRYDVNGGADFGYKVTSGLAVTLGYRDGHQYQQALPSTIDKNQYSATSDYQRVLLGVEGSPWKWLTLSAQGGPDFRSYDATGISSPVPDHNTTTYYGEASATANISDNDKLSLRYKQWRWVSSTGKVPLNDSLYELGYKRKLTSQLAWDLTGRVQSSDYTCGNAGTTSLRIDYLYTITTGLTFAVNRNLSFNAAYNLDLGLNDESNGKSSVASTYPYREYNRNLVSLSTTLKW